MKITGRRNFAPQLLVLSIVLDLGRSTPHAIAQATTTKPVERLEGAPAGRNGPIAEMREYLNRLLGELENRGKLNLAPPPGPARR